MNYCESQAKRSAFYNQGKPPVTAELDVCYLRLLPKNRVPSTKSFVNELRFKKLQKPTYHFKANKMYNLKKKKDFFNHCCSCK